jgi:Cu-processing system ATP-binding protein
MIELIGVRKRFGALEVLGGVDLAIAPGRVTAIVGPNSAGKTTLIKSILGLTRVDAGRILIDGEPIDSEGRYRADIGYMPQIARFPENLTAADLFAMMCDLRRSSVRDCEVIERLGLKPFLEKPLRVLSGGTRQKVNAALAFLFKPSILVLDEPTAGLDPKASSIVKDKIRAEQSRGRTVVVTSHVMSELDELADDIAFLVEGQVRFAGSVHDLKKMTRQLNLERAVAQVIEEATDAAGGAAA